MKIEPELITSEKQALKVYILAVAIFITFNVVWSLL